MSGGNVPASDVQNIIPFDWASPHQGILKLSGEVAAADDIEAVNKLAPAIAERLRWATINRGIPTSDTKALEAELRWRLSLCVDAISFLLITHLFTEFWLDLAMEQLVLRPPDELKYTEKLKLLDEAGHLSDPLAHNLRRLNRLRNLAAHRLNRDFLDEELNFRSFNGVALNSAKPSLDPDSPDYLFRLLNKVVDLTYVPLVQELGTHIRLTH